MKIGFLFWVLMVIWAVFWAWGRTPGGQPYWPVYHGWLIFILLFLLGWHVFGFVVQ